MTKEQNVFFKELNTQEKQSKLGQLSNAGKQSIIIWKKGTTQKIKLTPLEFVRLKNEMRVEEVIPDEYLNTELLVSFEINGLHFFGKCRSLSVSKKRFFLEFDEKLFKSERRSNFRLLTYPHQEVYVQIYIGEEKINESNLYQMKSGVNETKLFHNFLKIIDNDNKQKEGYLEFRVLDVSVTGMAIQLGEIEKELFPKTNIELGKVVINFNEEIIEIKNAKLLYILDFLTPNRKTKFYKAGVQFLEIDTNLDVKLAGIINATLRSLESEFEDFLK